jgi:hypothetical protein
MEASASTPLLAAWADPEQAEQSAAEPVRSTAATKVLILATVNVLVVISFVYFPALIFVLLIMQPVFCMLLVKFTVFPEEQPADPFEADAGLQAFEALPRRMLELVALAAPSWGWWSRVTWWKFGVVFVLIMASLALLYVCVLDPGFMMLYCVGQPLLVVLGGKWLLDYDALALRLPRFITLERVAVDGAPSAAKLPQSCAICLQDFVGVTDTAPDGVPEQGIRPGGADVPEQNPADQNITVMLGAAYPWPCRPDEVVRLRCDRTHCFHAACIEGWLLTNSTCPLCRTRIVEEFAVWRRIRQYFLQFSFIATMRAHLE